MTKAAGTPDWKAFFKAMPEMVSTSMELDGSCKHLSHTSTIKARKPGAICQASNLKYLLEALANPNIASVIIPESIAGSVPETDRLVVVASNPEAAFLKAHILHHETTSLAVETRQVQDGTVLVGDVRLGADVTIGPRCVLIGPLVIGDGSVIGPGAIIGEDGLFSKKLDGRTIHVPHSGGISIGSKCHIHAGAIIAKSAFHDLTTTVEDCCHIGIMTNIGHDAFIGEQTTISSNCVISGRSHVGKNVWIGATSTISNAVTVNDGAQIKLGSVVINDVGDSATVSGNFASNHRQRLLQHARSN